MTFLGISIGAWSTHVLSITAQRWDDAASRGCYPGVSIHHHWQTNPDPDDIIKLAAGLDVFLFLRLLLIIESIFISVPVAS